MSKQTKKPSKRKFKAEVRQVLDIVVNSLYKDKEIFIRELISNASDALEKMRRIQLVEKEIFDDHLDLEINVTTDDEAGTLTIQDFGIGMTEEELVKNLGTIAHSGSKAFLEALEKKGDASDALIGQFGVGFYSSFMVAKEVKVFTRSWRPDATGQRWRGDGSGTYEIEEVDGQRRGAKVVVKLGEEHKDFSRAEWVKGVIRKYSSFIQFPVSVNGDRVNVQEALWLREKSSIKEEEYTEFYKFQANDSEDPLLRFHFAADAPLAINALLFVPKTNLERMGLFRTECGVSLHCRKVLIEAEPKGLFPEWMRFLRGVVDSADMPLNVSRETLQDSDLLRKLNQVLSKRFLKFLSATAEKDNESYQTFWKEFGLMIKEGAATDFTHREALAKLLLFESSLLDKAETTGLDGYLSRMKDEQEEIYFLFGQSREAIEASPYLETFRSRGLEVIFLYEGVDEYLMQTLREFEGKKFVSADSEEAQKGEFEETPKGERLDEKETTKLCKWMKKNLGERVKEVEESSALVDSPACVLDVAPMGGATARRMMKLMRRESEEPDPPPEVKLQVNPRHALIRNLASLRESNAELASLATEQLLDNALAAAGLLDDPADSVARSYKLLEKVTAS